MFDKSLMLYCIIHKLYNFLKCIFTGCLNISFFLDYTFKNCRYFIPQHKADWYLRQHQIVRNISIDISISNNIAELNVQGSNICIVLVTIDINIAITSHIYMSINEQK